MAIELLDEKRQWAKVKAGWGEQTFFKNPQKTPTHPYKVGRDMMADQAQHVMKPPASAWPSFVGSMKK